ncbi:MAG: DNA polymerase III subunit beta [Erysipelotrichaceae bacterium]|nr:DNA polymerase III subunit beta [Erysipelotrichaceae bacterium]
MNITISREVLLENLNIISRGLPSKSPMPILTGIKFEATDTELYMTSSNTDISVEVLIANQELIIKEPGKTVVPGKFFIEIIRKINAKNINLYLIEDRTLVIKADRIEYKLHIMDYMDYPKIDFVTLENPLILNAPVLKSLIKETVFATAASEKKPILTGVNFKHSQGNLIATATDSFRLSQKIVKINEYNDFNITIPNKSLDELLRAIDNYEDEIELYFSNNKLLAKYKNVLFQTRLLDGNYPDTSKLIPNEFPIVIKFNKDELVEAVERVSLLSPRDKEKDREITYSIIKLSIKKDSIIEISTTNATIGDAKEELIPTNIEANNPIVIGFSSRYLLEALRSFISTEISLNLSGEIRPFIIRGDKDSNLTQLILPVRMD